MSRGAVQISGLTKTYTSPGQSLEVLKGVHLEIAGGDIFGIVGFSGAGKSTLIRCINRLETPDQGTIRINDLDITSLSKKELPMYRRKIGMVFQHFHLLDSRTVYGNVAFPLELAGYGSGKIRSRVEEILALVGLTDKMNAWPGQLSGGQKQRVGIARALAGEPEVLLSDEATSALDPLTTLSVLDLLKEINQKLGLTILMITHELNVVRYVCNQMAVLEEGRIVEQGSVQSVFLNPASSTAKLFLKIHEGFATGSFNNGEGI